MKKLLMILLSTTSLALYAAESADTPPKEGFFKSVLTRTLLPEIKTELAETKEFLLFGQECFPAASTLEDANACNATLRKMSRKAEFARIEMDDFEKWDEQELNTTLRQIDEMLRGMQCPEEARNLTELEACPEIDDPE